MNCEQREKKKPAKVEENISVFRRLAEKAPSSRSTAAAAKEKEEKEKGWGCNERRSTALSEEYVVFFDGYHFFSDGSQKTQQNALNVKG